MASILDPDIEPALESMIYKLRDARTSFLDADYQRSLAILRDVADDIVLTHSAMSIVWLRSESAA